MAHMLETPSRVWRRIEDIDGQEMPSLPSIPVYEDSADHASDITDSMSLDNDSLNPITSTPAAFSSHTNTMTTIRPPPSAGSTARFAQSIASRSSKSGLGTSGSRLGSSGSTGRPSMFHGKEQSFDISGIPSLPNMNLRDGLDDVEIRSSDQETTEGRDNSMPDAYLPPIDADTGAEEEFDLSDALQSISRSNSPSPKNISVEPTPKKKYDYSISLRSEPQGSPFDKLRNVSFRRPLARIRTPSLTRTITPSPSSSVSSNSTPQSTRQYPRSQTASPGPNSATNVPLPRSATASPMPTARSATPLSARTVPLPRSATASPIVPRPSSRGHTSVGSDEAYDEAPTSLPLPSLSINDVTMGTDISTENETGLNPEGQSQSEREPTFSSEEGLTQSSRGGNDSTLRHNNNSPASLASAFSSPIPSASTMMTPTPAFQSRPRARFNLQPMQVQASTTPPDPPNEESHDDVSEHTNDSTWHADQQQNYSDAVPATPASNAHKRSFLLSVINSTARPRLKYPTPHPHRVDVSEAPVPETPGVNMQTALAGATPRPRVPVRPRLSHPLAQGWTAKSDSGSGSESASRAQSPGGYDGAVDRASFISTASSQDLTTNVRANASFDPVMGLGDRGHGVGRFNAGKLNNYLHGLNRKLQEENESLMAQLRAYEEKHGSGVSSVSAVDTQTTELGDSVQHARRRSNVGRRVSAGPLGLGDVAEDMEEEKAAMEEMLEEFKEELEKVSVEKEEVEKEKEGIQRVLEEERAERLRDKERWRERMGEVEKGVQNIVEDLDRKLQEAEQRVQLAEREKIQTVKEVERRLAEVVVERDILAERMEKAEGALESGRDLGGELNAANERVGKVLGDLKNANIQINDLEDQVVHADERIDSLEHELQDEKKLVSELEEELQLKSEELSQTLQRIGMLESDLNSAHDELDGYKVNAAQLEEDAGAALEHIESLEQQLAVAQERLEAVTEVLDQERDNTGRLEGEAARASSLAKRMEEALEAAEKNMLSDEEQVANLRTKVAALERELDRSRSRIEPSQIGMDAEAEAQIESLEAELEDAHKEIARLNALVSQSPARKAVENAKNAKIEILEQERDDLLDRLKSAKTNSIMLSTPGRRASSSGLSPMHRQILSLSMKSPRTPGGPLRDLSWLQTTMHDSSMSPLVAEIARLHQELERANESIDDKLDRLEDAGLGVVSLTEQLTDSKTRITCLEDELGRLGRKEERQIQRLEKLRCQKCSSKVDTRALQRRHSPGDDSSIIDLSHSSITSEPTTSPTNKADKLRVDLQAVNAQLSSMKQQWDFERRKLMGDNAVLQDATSRLNAEVRQAKNEIQRFNETERSNERAKAGMQGELEKAKRLVNGLENELKTERARLRALATERSQAERQKEEVVLQLQRTESDMADVREELQKAKHENRELEDELRANTNADQKARLLESKVATNIETIEQLRKERSMLVADHKKLQHQFAQVSEHVNKLREQHATSQNSHDERRHKLDLQLLEIEDLRRELSERAEELEKVEAEKKRMANEQTDMAREVAALEADLRRVRKDAEAFGRDLKALHAQKDRLEVERKQERAKVERSQKQMLTQVRLLKEEAKEYKEKARMIQEQWKDHACVDDQDQLGALKLQHNKECKGLIVQIRYLKAKWTRESTLRSDLGYQKQYLLVLLARCERNEQKILAAIAKIGFPARLPNPAPTTSRRKTLKNVTHSVIFLLRAKRASETWRQQCSAKEAIATAIQDVRRRRTVKDDQ